MKVTCYRYWIYSWSFTHIDWVTCYRLWAPSHTAEQQINLNQPKPEQKLFLLPKTTKCYSDTSTPALEIILTIPLYPTHIMSNQLALFVLPAEDCFDGNNWFAWHGTIWSAAGAWGVQGYLEGTIQNHHHSHPERHLTPQTTGGPRSLPLKSGSSKMHMQSP